MVKKNEKIISSKNYVLALLIFIGVVLLTIYIFKWYQIINVQKISTSYLISNKVVVNEINSLDELEDIFSETADDYILYIGYTKDTNVYNMEKRLKSVINKYDLNDMFYYLNVDSIKDDENYLDEVNAALHLENKKIQNIPAIIYYKNHEVYKDGILNTTSEFKLDKDLNKLIKNIESTEE